MEVVATHNRWHPAVAPTRTVCSGEHIELELRDGLAGQVSRSTSVDAMAAFDMERCHPLTGPIAIAEAEPGDVVDVEILSLKPGEYGATVVLPGFGLLGDRVSRPLIVHWDLHRDCARSPQIPGVTVRSRPFLGIVGVAPSAASMAAFAARERAVATPHPPDARSAEPPSAADGLRTVPPRETGGNLDVRHAVAGSVVSLRVDCPGALVSVGDPHFAQGDGEVCGSAIETTARAELRLTVRRPAFRPRFPTIRAPEPCQTRAMLYTTGISSGVDGAGGDRDLATAARAALEDMHDYLMAEHGLDAEQAYALMSVAVDLQVSQAVNGPNALVSAALPLEVFDER